MMKKILVFILSTGCVYVLAQSKADCKKQVVLAESKFLQGLYNEAEVIVKKTLNDCKLSRRSKVDAYEILTRLNIETDNLDEAYINLKKLIKLNPNYIPNSAKVEEDFVKYFNKYKITPVLTAGMYYEAIAPSFHTIGSANSILGGFDYTAKYKPDKASGCYGIQLTLGLPTQTRFSFSPGIMNLSYKRKIESTSIKYYNTTLNENDTYINLPIDIIQHYKFKHVTVFGGLGYSFCLLNSANATIKSSVPFLDYDTTNFVGLNESKKIYFTDKSSIDMKSLRRNIDYFRLHLGATYNVSNFIVELRYTYSAARHVMNSWNYYLPFSSIYKTGYIDNSFYSNNSSFSLSLNYIIFHNIRRRNEK